MVNKLVIYRAYYYEYITLVSQCHKNKNKSVYAEYLNNEQQNIKITVLAMCLVATAGAPSLSILDLLS